MVDINNTKEWLADCIRYGACSKCKRYNDSCFNAKTLTMKALEAILSLEEELAKAKGQKSKGKPVSDQIEALKQESLAISEERKGKPAKTATKKTTSKGGKKNGAR